ncbi:MAG: triosephosphate isomerase [Bacilli bacterium]|nr:triosephosphate isomerase [Bacilli bacterium]
MKKLIVLNHKMNLEYDEVAAYIDGLNGIDTENNVIVCPSNIYLCDFINHCTWGVGAQNVSEKLDGNYTGEVSTLQLKSLGVEYSIVGHYERKKYFHETNIEINKKINACLDSNISPIICFGENGDVDKAINDLGELLVGIDNINFIIFAYEPLKVAEKESVVDIQSQVKTIYEYLYDKYEVRPNLIYGGGIASKDINELLELDELNGIMIGKISANIDKTLKIIKTIK